MYMMTHTHAHTQYECVFVAFRSVWTSDVQHTLVFCSLVTWVQELSTFCSFSNSSFDGLLTRLDVLVIAFIPSIHPHPPPFLTASISRSHCGELLGTGANIFSICSTFQSCIDLMEQDQRTGNTLRVSSPTPSWIRFPSLAGPKLICCGQIECKGKNGKLLAGCCGPNMSHLYLSQHPQTAAEREWPLTGNFTPPLPHVFPPLDLLLHAFLVDSFTF